MARPPEDIAIEVTLLLQKAEQRRYKKLGQHIANTLIFLGLLYYVPLESSILPVGNGKAIAKIGAGVGALIFLRWLWSAFHAWTLPARFSSEFSKASGDYYVALDFLKSSEVYNEVRLQLLSGLGASAAWIGAAQGQKFQKSKGPNQLLGDFKPSGGKPAAPDPSPVAPPVTAAKPGTPFGDHVIPIEPDAPRDNGKQP